MDDIMQYPVEAMNEYHVACVLLLDTSSSMMGTPIESLNQGLHQFKNDTLQKLDELRGNTIDVAVVEFNDQANVLQSFIPLSQFEPPHLRATGMTAMGEGIFRALDLIEERKSEYKSLGTPYYRPWIMMITDGGPNDSNYQEAFRILAEAEKGNKVMTWAIGVEGYAEDVLKQLMPHYNATIDGQVSQRQRIFRLGGLNFADLFEWLSNSLASLSTSVPGTFKGVETPDAMTQVEDDPYGFG
jgi:uncharacterized protein YegL